MKQSESKQTQPIPTTLVLVPTDMLELMVTQQQEILSIVKGQIVQPLPGYICEADAMKLLGRKSTWFWSQRKKGKLGHNKMGRKVFYSRADIIALIEQGAVKSFEAKRR